MKMGLAPIVGYAAAGSAIVIAGLLLFHKSDVTDVQSSAATIIPESVPRSPERDSVGRTERLALISAGAFVGFIAYLLHLKEGMAQLASVAGLLLHCPSRAAVVDTLLKFDPNQIILTVVWTAFILFPPAGLIALLFQLLPSGRSKTTPR
jgi:hypothetical protein